MLKSLKESCTTWLSRFNSYLASLMAPEEALEAEEEIEQAHGHFRFTVRMSTDAGGKTAFDGIRLQLNLKETVLINLSFVSSVFICVMLVIFAGETNSQWLYLLSAAMISALGLSFLLPWMQITDVDAQAFLPPHAISGETAVFKVDLKRLRKYGWIMAIAPVRFLQVKLNITRLGEEHHAPILEPLILRKLEGDCALYAASIPLKRGMYRLSSVELASCFPFGLVWWVRRIPQTDSNAEPLDLTVYPFAFALPGNFLMKLNAATPMVGMLSRRANQSQPTICVQGVREYVRGDSPRLIHWASSAKFDKLLVREFESEGLPGFDVLIDLKWDWGSEDLFEMAIELAFSILHLGYRWGLTPKLIVRNNVLVAPIPPMPPGMALNAEIMARLQPYRKPEVVSKVAPRQFKRIESIEDLIKKAREGAIIFLPPKPEEGAIDMILIEPVGQAAAKAGRSRAHAVSRGPAVAEQPEKPKSAEELMAQMGKWITTVNSREEIKRL